MKLFSPKGRPPSRAAARNATLLNQLATPGLGSLLARRWIAGTGQLLLALAGFVFYLIWFFKEMNQYYGQIYGDVPVQPVGKYLETGVILFGGAWLWAWVTSFSLLHQAATAKRTALENFAAPPRLKLAGEKISPALVSIPDWQLLDGKIVRSFEFKDFPAAIQFVQSVAALAEQAWHHPDIDIRWNKVTLTLTTHDAGGLTEKDFALARQFDRL
jgi:4a-hydroxytetrahydrobiopterin dehydratase